MRKHRIGARRGQLKDGAPIGQSARARGPHEIPAGPNDQPRARRLTGHRSGLARKTREYRERTGGGVDLENRPRPVIAPGGCGPIQREVRPHHERPAGKEPSTSENWYILLNVPPGVILKIVPKSSAPPNSVVP
jgi:hypothetical protein